MDSSKLLLGVAVVVAVAAGAMFLVQDGESAGSGAGAMQTSASEGALRRSELRGAEATEDRKLGAIEADAPVALQAEIPAPDVAEKPLAQSTAAPEALVMGRVVDPGGRPVAGARVVYHGGNESILLRRFGDQDRSSATDPEALSDRDGRFALVVPVPDESGEDHDDLPFFGASGARVVASHDAFSVLIHDCTAPELGSEVDLGTLAMAAGSQVEGRVVDESGRPVAQARVTARSHASDGGSRGGMMHLLGGRLADLYTTATTAADGRYRIHGVRPGPISLSAEADGFQVALLDDLSTEPNLTLAAPDLLVAAGATISGWIVDAQGEPLEGAEVRVSSLARLVIRRMEDLPRQQIGQEMRLRAETDAAGYFILKGLGMGQYTVHVSADGFATASRDNVPAGSNELSIALDKLGGLLVSVRSAVDDSMVEGAKIIANPAPQGGMFMGRRGGGPLDVLAGQEAVAASGVATDPEGMYFVSGAGANGLELEIQAQGFAAATVTTPAIAPNAVVEFDVLLRPESVLAGVVVDGSGATVAGATVRLAEYIEPVAPQGGRFEVRREISRNIGGAAETGDDWRRALTDEYGAFTMAGIPEGDWELKASADGFAGDEPTIVWLAEGQSRRDVEVTLLVAGSIAGVVIEQDGQPVKGAQITVTAVAAGNSTPSDPMAARLAALMGGDDSHRAHSDATGQFEVPDLLPGLYDVKLAQNQSMHMGGAMMIIMDGAGGGGDEGQRVEVLPREATWVEVLRPPTASLTGRVLAGGRPVAGATVELSQANSFMPFGGRPGETDSSGRYLFEDVEPGGYEVSVIVPGAALPEQRNVELRGGQESQLDLVFSGSTLSGRVLDRDSGQGVGGVTINLTSDAEVSSSAPALGGSMTIAMVSAGPGGSGTSMTMDMGGGDLSKVRTSPHGDFRIEWVKPGKYGIETQGGGYISVEAGPFEIDEGDVLDDIVIKADRGATLSGRVVSSQSGQLLDSVPVRLESFDGSESQMSMTSPEGRYSFEGLGAGEYSVSVMGSGFGSAPLASESITLAEGEPHTLDLTTTGEAVAPSGG